MTRWGIIATGRIAAAFADDLAVLDDAELVAVGSRSRETAGAFAAKHGIPRAHGSWAELAADPDVDAVYVATPHSAHHEAATLCLRAGKAVLCEKPLTTSLATAEDLVRTARERGVLLVEGMWMLTHPTILRVRDAIAEGAIGEVTHIAVDFGVPGPFPVGHRMRAPELGGGALLDLGVYPVALTQFLLGPPDAMHAWASLLPEGTDQNTAIILGYASGAVATLHAGIMGETAQRATITGTAGRIEIDAPFFHPPAYTLYAAGRTAERVVVPVRGYGLNYEAEEVGRCLRAGRTESPLLPHSSTLAVMRTLDAALRQIGVTHP